MSSFTPPICLESLWIPSTGAGLSVLGYLAEGRGARSWRFQLVMKIFLARQRNATLDLIFMECSQTPALTHHRWVRIFKHTLEVFWGTERNMCRCNSWQNTIVIGIAAGTSLRSMKLRSQSQATGPSHAVAEASSFTVGMATPAESVTDNRYTNASGSIPSFSYAGRWVLLLPLNIPFEREPTFVVDYFAYRV